MSDNLRQFVYLDATSVNSLLASRFMAVPETVRNVAEEREEQSDENSFSAGINLHSLLNLGGSSTVGSTEGQRELSEVGKRINDQYRFSILVRTLEQSDDTKIHDVSSGLQYDELEPGDLIRINARCTTDPLYPLLTALHYFVSAVNDVPQGNSFWSSLLQSQSQLGQVEQIYELLYGGWIGLKMEPQDADRNFGTVINDSETWVDPHREFRGSNEYTILGRVQNQLSDGEIWDIIEILRVLGSVASEDEMDERRIDLIIKMLDKLEEHNEETEEGENEFRLPEMDPDEFIIEGEATIVNPIAIYW